jgi:hypothetical protein
VANFSHPDYRPQQPCRLWTRAKANSGAQRAATIAHLNSQLTHRRPAESAGNLLYTDTRLYQRCCEASAAERDVVGPAMWKLGLCKEQCDGYVL